MESWGALGDRRRAGAARVHVHSCAGEQVWNECRCRAPGGGKEARRAESRRAGQGTKRNMSPCETGGNEVKVDVTKDWLKGGVSDKVSINICLVYHVIVPP